MAFIKLIKMMIAPIIFCTVVIGIAGMEDMKKKSAKPAAWPFCILKSSARLALVVGLFMVNILQPGVGMHIDVDSLDTKGISGLYGPRKDANHGGFL